MSALTSDEASSIPPDVLMTIASHAGKRGLQSMLQTCKTWNLAIKSKLSNLSPAYLDTRTLPPLSDFSQLQTCCLALSRHPHPCLSVLQPLRQLGGLTAKEGGGEASDGQGAAGRAGGEGAGGSGSKGRGGGVGGSEGVSTHPQGSSSKAPKHGLAVRVWGGKNGRLGPVTDLGSRWSCLKALDLSGQSLMAPTLLPSLAHGLPQLLSLQLQACLLRLSDLAAALPGLPKLEALGLAGLRAAEACLSTDATPPVLGVPRLPISGTDPAACFQGAGPREHMYAPRCRHPPPALASSMVLFMHALTHLPLHTLDLSALLPHNAVRAPVHPAAMVCQGLPVYGAVGRLRAVASLKALHLRGSRVSRSDLEAIGGMTHLEVLTLCWVDSRSEREGQAGMGGNGSVGGGKEGDEEVNSFTWPECVPHLTGLRSLDLALHASSAHLGSQPMTLAPLTQLTQLTLSGCCSLRMVLSIMQLKGLERLALRHMGSGVAMPELVVQVVGELPALEQLEWSYSSPQPQYESPGDILLRGLAVVRPALRLLLIPDCDMYGSGLTPSLPALPLLEQLCVGGPHILACKYGSLGELAGLRSLTLTGVGPRAFASAAKCGGYQELSRLTHLTQLQILAPSESRSPVTLGAGGLPPNFQWVGDLLHQLVGQQGQAGAVDPAQLEMLADLVQQGAGGGEGHGALAHQLLQLTAQMLQGVPGGGGGGAWGHQGDDSSEAEGSGEGSMEEHSDGGDSGEEEEEEWGEMFEGMGGEEGEEAGEGVAGQGWVGGVGAAGGGAGLAPLHNANPDPPPIPPGPGPGQQGVLAAVASSQRRCREPHLHFLTFLPGLRVLVLQALQSDGQCLRHLSALVGLRRLELTGVFDLTVGSLASLKGLGLPRLSCFHIGVCRWPQPPPTSPPKRPTQSPDLTKLFPLPQGLPTTATSASAAAAAARSGGDSGASTSAAAAASAPLNVCRLLEVLQHCMPAVESLTVEGCAGLTRTSLVALGQTLPHLKYLRLASAPLSSLQHPPQPAQRPAPNKTKPALFPPPGGAAKASQPGQAQSDLGALLGAAAPLLRFVHITPRGSVEGAVEGAGGLVFVRTGESMHDAAQLMSLGGSV